MQCTLQLTSPLARCVRQGLRIDENQRCYIPRLWGKRVLAKLIHLLTLIAFTAHAVCGCCAHHAHRDLVSCCAQPGQAGEAEAGAEDACERAHRVSQPGSSCCHDVPVAQDSAAEDPAGSAAHGQGAYAELQGGSECPGGHPHHCQGLRCTFVAGSLKQLEQDLAANCLTAAWLLDSDRLASHSRGQPHGLFRVSLQVDSSTTRCAWLQSWQI